jgi:hypothetical protein
LLEIRIWGIKWKREIDKTNDLATSRWTKAKINKRKFSIAQTNCKHSEGGYGRLPFGDVYTCHGFLSRTHKFEKINSRTFFHKFIKGFVNRGFGNLLLS